MTTTEKWDRQRSKLLKKFANLTDFDLRCNDGKIEQLLGRLQIKLGKTKEEMHQIIEGL